MEEPTEQEDLEGLEDTITNLKKATQVDKKEDSVEEVVEEQVEGVDSSEEIPQGEEDNYGL